jgi:hypothetical protein
MFSQQSRFGPAHEVYRIALVVRECRRAEASERFVNGTPVEAAAPEQRDRVIPLRKPDLIEGLVAEGRLDEAEQATLRQLARMLGAIFHYQYLEELDRLREIYFQFDPEIDPKICGPAKDIEAAYRTLSEEFVRVLTDANFIEITHDEITRAFAERARVRVKIKAPLEDYRDVRMFRRGHIPKPSMFRSGSACASIRSMSWCTTTWCGWSRPGPTA